LSSFKKRVRSSQRRHLKVIFFFFFFFFINLTCVYAQLFMPGKFSFIFYAFSYIYMYIYISKLFSSCNKSHNKKHIHIYTYDIISISLSNSLRFEFQEGRCWETRRFLIRYYGSHHNEIFLKSQRSTNICLDPQVSGKNCIIRQSC
jgi:hypothetical protein